MTKHAETLFWGGSHCSKVIHSSVMLRLKHYSEELQRRRVSAKLAKHFATKGEAFEGNEALSCSFSQAKPEDVAEDRSWEENWIQQLASKLKRPVLPRYCTAFHHLCFYSLCTITCTVMTWRKEYISESNDNDTNIRDLSYSFIQLSEKFQTWTNALLPFCLFVLCHRSL